MRLSMQLSLPTESRLLRKTRRAVAGYLEEYSGDADLVHDVLLAIDEACSNVIRHAYPDASDQHVFTLTAMFSGDEVVIAVEDHGVGIDLTVVDDPTSVPYATSGRGLHIIRQLMTSVELAPAEGGGTRLLMRRRLQPPVPALIGPAKPGAAVDPAGSSAPAATG